MDWIGANISVPSMVATDDPTVTATISKSRLDEVRKLTHDYLKQNVMPIKALRSYTGKVQSIAALLHTWRPFVSMLWGALYDKRPQTKAPPAFAWRTQIEEPPRWSEAFLRHAAGTLIREFSADVFFCVWEVSV